MRRTLMIALLLACAACSDGAAAVPEGYAVVERPAFTVAHPEAWDVVLDEEDSFEARGPVAEADIHPVVYVEVDRAFAGDFDHAVDGIDELGALTARPEREVVRDETTDVEGAEQGRLMEVTWHSQEDGVALRAHDVFAHTPDDLLVYLSIVVPESAYDEDTVSAIIDSFSVR